LPLPYHLIYWLLNCWSLLL